MAMVSYILLSIVSIYSNGNVEKPFVCNMKVENLYWNSTGFLDREGILYGLLHQCIRTTTHIRMSGKVFILSLIFPSDFFHIRFVSLISSKNVK